MARIRIHGSEYNLPEGQDFAVQAMEIDASGNQIRYQYTFRDGDPRVKLEMQVMEIEKLEGPGSCAFPSWERQPDKNINEFLLIEDCEPINEPHWTMKAAHRDHCSNPCNNPNLESNKFQARNITLETALGQVRSKNLAERYTSHFRFPKHSGADIEKGLIKPEEVPEMDEENRWSAGDRVVFRCPITGEERTGTVVGQPEAMRGKSDPESYLVCSDTTHQDYVNLNQYTGTHHGIIVRRRNMRRMDAPRWLDVPKHIALFVPEPFEYDEVLFSSGSVGRLLQFNDSGDQVQVGWDFDNDNFSSSEDSAGNIFLNSYYVPTDRVRWCNLSSKDGKHRPTLWPSGEVTPHPAKRPGDICLVNPRSVACVDKKGKEKILSGGTVVKLLKICGGSRRDQSWTCEILGNCDDSLIGINLDIQNRHLKPHPNPEGLYLPGQKVEIEAKVDFRKKPLQGMQGKVILMTDGDGDIGIEFPDDIGAGSLDGIGKEGHCIYIEAQAVKASE